MRHLRTLFIAGCCLLAVGGVSADQTQLMDQIAQVLRLETYPADQLQDRQFKGNAAFFFTVLTNQYEVHVHQLGGAIGNQTVVEEDGHNEAVYAFEVDKDGNPIGENGTLVEDCLNRGNFNYFHPQDRPMAHFAADMLPWIILGNCEDDPSSINERIEAYVRDHREAFKRAIEAGDGFYLPPNFNMRGEGQSYTYSLFTRALRFAEFDLDAFIPEQAHMPEMQEKYFAALELGLKRALRPPKQQ